MFIGLSLSLTGRLRSSGADLYAVAGFSPELVLDFATETYRVDGSTSTFSDALTYGGTGLRTMVDSDGLLKWGPHNYIAASTDFTTGWTSGVAPSDQAIVTANNTTAPDGTTTADGIAVGITTGANRMTCAAPNALRHRFAVFFKAGTASWVRMFAVGVVNDSVDFDLSNGVVGTVSVNNLSNSIEDYGDGWYLCTIETDETAGTITGWNFEVVDGDGSSVGVVGEYIYAWGAHLYRSDLGGMVANPDRGDSYVPTTSAAVYMPRRGNHVYNGTSWVNEGLLLESEQRENLVTYSEDFTSGTWGKTNSAVTDPSSTLAGAKAWTLTSTSDSGDMTFSALFGSGACCGSFIIKSGTLTSAEVRIGGSGNAAFCVFDLSAGTAGAVSTGGTATDAAAYIEDMGGGVYRCSVSAANVGGGSSVKLLLYPGSSSSGIGSVLASAAQFEAGSTPSSYIPTSGATVTRSAETLVVAGADMPFDASGVTIQMDGTITYADEGAAAQQTFARWYAGAADYITIDLDTDSTATGEVNFNQEDTTGGAGSVASSATALAAGVNTAFNIAGRFTAAEVNGAVGGTVATADTSPTILPDLSSTDFQIGHDFMGNVGQVRVWAADLTDANLDEATT